MLLRIPQVYWFCVVGVHECYESIYKITTLEGEGRRGEGRGEGREGERGGKGREEGRGEERGGKGREKMEGERREQTHLT